MKSEVYYNGGESRYPNLIEIIIIALLIITVIFLECWIIFVVNSLTILFIVFLCLFVVSLIALIVLSIYRCQAYR